MWCNVCWKTHFMVKFKYNYSVNLYFVIQRSANKECCECQPDPPENCHLNVQKLPKTWLFFLNCQNLSFFSKKLPLAFFLMTIFGNFLEKNVKFLAIFDSQMAVFRRVRSVLTHKHTTKCKKFLNLNNDDIAILDRALTWWL